MASHILLVAVAPLLLLRGVAAHGDRHSARSVQQDAAPSVKMRTLPGDHYRVFRRPKRRAGATRKWHLNPHASRPDIEPDIESHAFATPTAAPVESIPCPPGYDPRRTDYVAGDVVEVYNTMFVCQGGAYEEYCNVATWAQAQLLARMDGESDELEELWLNAWRDTGTCDPELVPAEFYVPTLTPSSSPSAMPSGSAMPSSSHHPTPSPTEMPTYAPTYFPTQYPTWHPTVSPSLSPTTFEPTSSPLALSPLAYVEQLPSENITCLSSQILFRIELLTDNYPTDISWQFIDRSNNVILLASPLEGYSGESLGNKMMVPQLDIRDICLNSASSDDLSASTEYEFVLEDEFADGLCCREGVAQGHYKLMQYNETVDGNWTVLASGSNFKTRVVSHYFELQVDNALGNALDVGGGGRNGTSLVPPLEQATLDEEMLARNEGASEKADKETTVAASQLKLRCRPPQRKITIEVQTDNFGLDTSWEFREKGGAVLAKNERVYQNKVQIDTRDVCLNDSSLYEMEVNDEMGDGMCCRYNEGHYKIYDQHGEVILHGGSFLSKAAKHLINTTMPYMNDRDKQWLESHNKRRKYWHAHYNTSYVPLLWDESLKAEAKVWADTLLNSCGDGMHHDPERAFGENAAGNTGNGSWGTKREPDKIVARFVEREVDWPWPENGHLTQTLWRSSKYVGCADSHKPGEKKGHNCHTQVCRYARTGNCNMNAHTNDDGTVDWLTPMLEDVSHCGPICPTAGCRA